MLRSTTVTVRPQSFMPRDYRPIRISGFAASREGNEARPFARAATETWLPATPVVRYSTRGTRREASPGSPTASGTAPESRLPSTTGARPATPMGASGEAPIGYG